MNHEDAKHTKAGGMNKGTDDPTLEKIAAAIVDSALTVHRELGPGLLESSYQLCLAHELRCRGFSVALEVPCPIAYKSIRLDCGYRIDMLIDAEVIVENKTVDILLPIHKAQLLTYMKLAKKRLGFLINWNVPLLKNGLHRMIL